MKITKQFCKENLRLNRNTTPGSTLRSCLRVPQEIEWSEELSARLYSNLEKWGWIEDRGMYILTREGFGEIPFV
jgi:hypothetical protein